MRTLQPVVYRSSWRIGAVSGSGVRPDWGHTAPALDHLGTAATPQIPEEASNLDPRLVDWDWVELDEFADQVRLAGS